MISFIPNGFHSLAKLWPIHGHSCSELTPAASRAPLNRFRKRSTLFLGAKLARVILSFVCQPAGRLLLSSFVTTNLFGHGRKEPGGDWAGDGKRTERGNVGSKGGLPREKRIAPPSPKESIEHSSRFRSSGAALARFCSLFLPLFSLDPSRRRKFSTRQPVSYSLLFFQDDFVGLRYSSLKDTRIKHSSSRTLISGEPVRRLM